MEKEELLVQEPVETPEGVEESTAPVDGIDYKAEFEKTMADNIRLAEANENYRIGIKQAKKKNRIETDEDEESEPVTPSQTDEAMVNALISTKASNPEEAKLIRYHFDNSTHPSSDVMTRLDNAKALANKALIAKQLSEVQRVKSTTMPSNSTGGSGIAEAPKPETNFGWSQAQLEFLKAKGLDPKVVAKNMSKSI